MIFGEAVRDDELPYISRTPQLLFGDFSIVEDILKIRRLAGIEIDPLLVEDKCKECEQVRAKHDSPAKHILNPHRSRNTMLRQVPNVHRRLRTQVRREAQG